MTLFRFALRRFAYLVPQLIGVIIVAFLILRLTPGDPALRILGGQATEEQLRSMRERMGLSGTLPEQLSRYVAGLASGDMGTSWFTSQPVAKDLMQRVPATLELITLSLAISVVLSLLVAMVLASNASSLLARGITRVIHGYAFLAGALPDFWVAILLIFVLYTVLGWASQPLGQLDIAVLPPERRTGFLLVDSVLAGNLEALQSHLSHLVMPVAALVFVYSGNILKITVVSVTEALRAPYMKYAKAFGLSSRTMTWYAIRNALPPIVTITGVTYSFLLGGAVLIEAVFGWGGLGQYAVHAVVNSDYPGMQGFILVAALFSLVVYLVVDLLYFLVNPRMRY
jgi:peptide/nickel transport system permease protein